MIDFKGQIVIRNDGQRGVVKSVRKVGEDYDLRISFGGQPIIYQFSISFPKVIRFQDRRVQSFARNRLKEINPQAFRSIQPTRKKSEKASAVQLPEDRPEERRKINITPVEINQKPSSTLLTVDIVCNKEHRLITIVDDYKEQCGEQDIYWKERYISRSIINAILKGENGFVYEEKIYHFGLIAPYNKHWKNFIDWQPFDIPAVTNDLYIFRHKHISEKNRDDFELVNIILYFPEKKCAAEVPVYLQHSNNMFFLNEETYEYFRKEYGDPQANLHWTEPGTAHNSDYSGNRTESTLKRCGYNVQQLEGLSTQQRRQILLELIESNELTECEITSHLEMLLHMNADRDKMAVACDRWADDLRYVQEKLGNQRRVVDFTQMQECYKGPVVKVKDNLPKGKTAEQEPAEESVKPDTPDIMPAAEELQVEVKPVETGTAFPADPVPERIEPQPSETLPELHVQPETPDIPLPEAVETVEEPMEEKTVSAVTDEIIPELSEPVGMPGGKMPETTASEKNSAINGNSVQKEEYHFAWPAGGRETVRERPAQPKAEPKANPTEPDTEYHYKKPEYGKEDFGKIRKETPKRPDSGETRKTRKKAKEKPERSSRTLRQNKSWISRRILGIPAGAIVGAILIYTVIGIAIQHFSTEQAAINTSDVNTIAAENTAIVEGTANTACPESGTLLYNYYADLNVPLTIVNNSDSDCVLITNGSGVTAQKIYMRPHETAQVQSPMGTYTLEIAAGSEWVNEEDLFGTGTVYYTADEQLVYPWGEEQTITIPTDFSGFTQVKE